MEDPEKRFARWVAGEGSQANAARTLGCTAQFVHFLIEGQRRPGRKLANAIEAATRDWSEGPILSEHWDSTDEAAE